MNIVSQTHPDEKTFNDSVRNFMKKFKFGQALFHANAYKVKGIPVTDVFRYLFQLVFTHRSMYMNLLKMKERAEFMKDVAYRFLNSLFINWQRFITEISFAVINEHITPLTAEGRRNVFIVDDTFYGRERSKRVEMLTTVHDHTDGRYKKGFRLLTLGWSDGSTFIPVNFALLTSENEKKHICEMKNGLRKNTNGYKRRLQAKTKAPEVLLQLLDEAVAKGFPAEHILFDSWFSAPSALIAISKRSLHVVARVKNTSKVHYQYKGDSVTLSSIYKANKKRRGRSRYLLSVTAAIHNTEGETMDVRIVFVRDRNNRKKWIAILSTDLELSEEEIIRTYGKRWDIEVFFKMCKSYLRLSKEFQGLSYDLMVAHTAIVFSRYILLAVENRNATDQRTLGEMFFFFVDEAQDIQFFDVLQMLLKLLAKALEDFLHLTKAEINAFLDRFIATLPKYILDRLRVPEIA
jgi:hypothetical protein